MKKKIIWKKLKLFEKNEIIWKKTFCSSPRLATSSSSSPRAAAKSPLTFLSCCASDALALASSSTWRRASSTAAFSCCFTLPNPLTWLSTSDNCANKLEFSAFRRLFWDVASPKLRADSSNLLLSSCSCASNCLASLSTFAFWFKRRLKFVARMTSFNIVFFVELNVKFWLTIYSWEIIFRGVNYF